MVKRSSEDFPNLARAIRESMDGRLPPIDDPDVKTYSYALYNCEYCNMKIFLSLETKAAFNTPYNSIPGAILILWNEPKRGRPKKGKRRTEFMRKALCLNCYKDIGPDNFGGRICSARYVRPESTKEHLKYMEGWYYR
jgi:DNA-directed RNA polymerase subunit RPC12/RpoP